MLSNIKNILFVLFLSYSFLNANSNKEWQGQYIGFAIGQGEIKTNSSITVQEKGYFVNEDPEQLNPLASENLTDSSAIGSIIWGYNRQNQNFVYGLESDISLSDFNDKNNTGNINYITMPASTFNIQSEIKSKYLISIRPRIGYATNKSLFTISAGPALTKVDYRFNFSDTNTPEYSSINEQKWALGLSAGIGYEYLLSKDWRIKMDYLYYKFNNVINKKSQLSNTSADGFNHNIDFEINTFRIGFIKKF